MTAHGPEVKGNLLILLIAVSLSALLAEMVLRKLGYSPGKHTTASYFNPVDTLETKLGFGTDSTGIFIISQEGREAVWSLNQHENLSPEISRVIEFSTSLRAGQGDGELADAYRDARQLAFDEKSFFRQRLINYVDSGVNAVGFRSIAFQKFENDKPSILLLGDSYTFGHSASVYHKSFSDILLARGYTVYNSGITGTDVAQYLAIAKHWIPRLSPDVVIVNFYVGNDIAFFKREVGPENPVFFSTNAGIMMACPDGVQLQNAAEAYALCMHWVGIPPERGTFERIMSITAITSAIYGVLWRNNIIRHQSQFIKDYLHKVEKARTVQPHSRMELLAIDSIARSNGARPIISIIPEMTDSGFRTAKDVPDALTGINYAEMTVTREDCDPRGGHFNDHGHRRYADFLQKLIDEE